MFEGISDAMEFAIEPDEAARIELAEIKGIVVEDLLCFGVRGDMDLGASVELEAFVDVGPHSASHPIGRLG